MPREKRSKLPKLTNGFANDLKTIYIYCKKVIKDESAQEPISHGICKDCYDEGVWK